MKLILTQEVAGLGGPGDIVEVKDGYGRNYLLPRGAGIRWTRGGEKQVSSIRRGREVRQVADLGSAQEVKGQLENLSVTLPVKAGGPAVDKRRIEIGQPIKTVGDHQVTVRLHPEVVATLTVQVVAAA